MSDVVENRSIQGPEEALKPALNYQYLRNAGLNTIIQTGSDEWTDYNEHDPGITILETLIYSLTDLAYRTEFPITDIIAQQQSSYEHLASKQFYTARDILTTHPVTFNDLRKLIVDQEGVGNAWVRATQDSLNTFGGMIDLFVDPYPELKDAKAQQQLKEQVEQVYYSHRSLGQDLRKIVLCQPFPIIINLELVIDTNVVAEEVVAKVLFTLEQYLSSTVNFLSLAEMMEQMNGEVNAVFDGPPLMHGFLPDDALLPMKGSLRSIDLIPILQKVAGVVFIPCLNFRTLQQEATIIAQNRGTKREGTNEGKWFNEIQIAEDQSPRLAALDQHQLTVQKGDTPCQLNSYKLAFELKKLNSKQRAPKLVSQARNLPIPLGTYRDIENYHSIQHDFPMLYGLDPNGPPPQASDARLGQIKQLKAYLLVFDQIMADYLAQLSNLARLFSWDQAVKRTYFFQGLESSVGKIWELLVGMPPHFSSTSQDTTLKVQLGKALISYKEQLAVFREDESTFLSRRNRFLDHLLARFGRSLTIYTDNINQQSLMEREAVGVETKQRVLNKYAHLSAQRGRAYDRFKTQRFDDEFSGLRMWVETLFDMTPEDIDVFHFNKRFVQDHFNSKTDSQHAFSKYVLATQDHSRLDFKEVVRIGGDPANYYVDHQPDKGHHIELYKLTNPLKPSKIYRLTDHFKTAEETLEVIDDLANLIGRYDRTSERIYLVEHLLLRPTEIEFYFGLELLDGAGQVWMKTKGWYSKTALQAVTTPPDSDTQFYSCIKKHTACEQEVVDRKKSTVGHIVKKKITAKYQFSIQAVNPKATPVKYKVELQFGKPGELIKMESTTPFESEALAIKAIQDWVALLKKHFTTSSAPLWRPLLKPWKSKMKKQYQPLKKDPYSFVLTVVIPNWPSRFQEKGFKKALEQVIHRESPAHLWPNIIWLNKTNFQRFQNLYFMWWSAYIEGEPDAYCYRKELMEFIVKYSAWNRKKKKKKKKNGKAKKPA